MPYNSLYGRGTAIAIGLQQPRKIWNPVTVHDASQRKKPNNMKQTLERKHCSGKTGTSTFPLTDCNYYAATLPHFHGSCARQELPSFRNISRDYFRNEAPGEFRAEFIAFGAIIVTAVIPILSNMHALADFLRAIGSL
jgi:hypothetical protein